MAGNKTVRASALGAELRKYRNAAGMTARDMGGALGCGYSTVTRWETGERSPSSEDVAAFLVAAGAPAEARHSLADLARDSDNPHWLSVGMPGQQQQLVALLEIERAATKLWIVSPLLVPGLLQIPAYARAVMAEAEVPTDQVDVKVAVRIGRRDAITRRNPLALQAFIWEPVLHQLVGDDDVMTEQLQFLLEVGDRDNVNIRIIPTRCNPGLEGPFSVAEFEDRTPTVHLENKISGLFLHEPDEVAAYLRDLARMEEKAFSPKRSLELIANVINNEETTR